MNQKSDLTYPMQLGLLLLLAGVCLVLAALVVAMVGPHIMHRSDFIAAMSDPENADAARWLNTIAAFFSFFVPALILALIVSRRPFAHLGFNGRMSINQVLLVVVITFAGMVLGGALGELNERIPLPANWYAQFKKLEDTYKAAMMAMATMRSLPEYISALIVIAAAPALFEEVLFRGSLQQIMIGLTKNKWAGIIITSVLFSAIHLSYFGFLPRVALGIILGLVFYYGRNIWLNIFLHFLNNALIVTQLYMVSRQGRSIEKTLDESMPIWWGAIAIVVLVIIFRAFRTQSAKLVPDAHSSHENIVS